MSRSAAAHDRVMTGILDAIVKKKDSYARDIGENHAASKMVAERVVVGGHNGDMEQVLLNLASSEQGAVLTEEEVQTFLTEQRTRLKALAEKNQQSERTVDAFVASMKQLQSQVTNSASNNNSQDDAGFEDYSDKIQQLLQQEQTKRSTVPLKEGKYYQEICDSMGEQQAGTGGDDDIEVMHNTQQQQSLKCPITGLLFTDPVRNKQCGHVYDRQGIQSHLRMHKHQCPVAGCNNNSLSMTQVEPDTGMMARVRREKKRQTAQEQARSSQADILADTDEE